MCTLNGVRKIFILKCLIVSHSEFVYHSGNLLRTEEAHKFVLEGDVECGATRVALTSGTSAQLAVHTAGIMPLGAEDGETAGRLHFR